MGMKMFFAFTVASVLCCCDAKILKMVHLVYRHGARSPIHFYPTDRYQAKDWPDGAGRLTQQGMNMEYDLGKFLKKRYIEDRKFLNQTYLHGEVYIRSSNIDRCLQSAGAQLAGLYPPTGYQVWNKDIPWQPIPVHTVERSDVLLRPSDIPCARLDQVWEQKKSDPEYKAMEEANRKLMQELSQHAGMKVTPENIRQITDPTACEIEEGFPVPEWLQQHWLKTDYYWKWLISFKFSGDDELGRLLGGTLLGRINRGMIAQKKSMVDLHKMNIFSAHDSTLLSLSTALDITIEFPNFSACIMVELYEEDGQQFVEMYYRNTYTDNVSALKLKKCQHSCPLNDFLRLTKPRTTEDRSKICSVKGGSLITMFNLEVAVIFLSGLLLILLLLLVCFVTRRPVPGSKYKKTAFLLLLDEVGAGNEELGADEEANEYGEDSNEEEDLAVNRLLLANSTTS